MDKPLISIIVPVYNSSKWIAGCVESVLCQTYSNFELILVDDGSTDSSGVFCNDWADRDPRIHALHQTNRGVLKAREFGVLFSKGEYVTFLDSDDKYEEDTLYYLYSLIKKYDADFAMGMHVRFKENPRIKIQNHSWEEYKNTYGIVETRSDFCISNCSFINSLFKINTQINVQYVWGKIFKKNIVLNNFIDSNIVIAEDTATIFSIACDAKKIAIGSDTIYNYRANDESLTKSPFSDKNFGLLKAWDIIEDIAEKKNAFEQIKKSASFNRKRADFGLLVNLCMDKNFFKLKKKYKKEIKIIQKRLRKNKIELLKGQIPLSRKIAIILFSISYTFFGSIINLILKLK